MEREVPHVTTMSKNIFLNGKLVLVGEQSGGMTKEAPGLPGCPPCGCECGPTQNHEFT